MVKRKSEPGYEQLHVPVRITPTHTLTFGSQPNPLQLRLSCLLQLALGLPPFVRLDTLLLVPHQHPFTRQRQ